MHAGSICAVAPSERSRDPVWLMKIEQHRTAITDLTDSSGLSVCQGQEYLEAHWLEQHGETKTKMKFEVKSDTVFLFKESVVYPFVNHTQGKKENEVIVDKGDYYDILVYVDEYGMSAI